MTTVADAIKETGLVAPEGTGLVLVTWKPDGKPLHHTYDQIAGWDLAACADLYVASGAFRSGSIVNNTGRRQENVAAVLSLPFDMDIADYLGMPDAERGDVYAMAQDDIDLTVRDLAIVAQRAFADLGIPIHRLDYTGHGLCAHLYLRDTTADDLPTVRAAYKALVARINEHTGFILTDRQVSDAGTRVTRVPGTLNTKGAEHRRVQTIAAPWRLLPRMTVAQLETLAGTRPDLRRARIAPIVTKYLPGDISQEVIEAVAPHWTLGQKHILALGLSGMLAKAGVSKDQALAMIEALSAEDAKPWDRRTCVESTYQRLEAGQDVRGFQALRDYLPESVIAFVDDRLQAFRDAAATGPRLIAGGKSTREAGETPKAVTYPVAPQEAYYGWFGAYRDLMAPTTEAPDCFHLGSALTLAGAMVGRRIWTRYASEQLYPNFYTLLIGASGSSRKDTAIKRALKLPQIALSARRLTGPPFAVRRDISSGEGLVAILKDEPNILLYISELTTMLRNIKRESTKSLGDKLIEAWDTPSTLQNLNKQSPIYAVNPYLSIIAGTQPGRLEEEMTDTEINSGFGNRWMFFAGSAKPRMANPPDVDERAAADLYASLQDAIRVYGDDHCIRLAKGAQPRWDAWYLDDDVAEEDEDRQAMRIRHASLIQKTALLYAVTDAATEIEDKHLAAAIALIEWMWSVVQILMPTWGSTADRKIEERILRILHRNPVSTRREIQQYTRSRKWGARDFAAVFRAMQENGTILVDASGNVTLPLPLSRKRGAA